MLSENLEILPGIEPGNPWIRYSTLHGGALLGLRRHLVGGVRPWAELVRGFTWGVQRYELFIFNWESEASRRMKYSFVLIKPSKLSLPKLTTENMYNIIFLNGISMISSCHCQNVYPAVLQRYILTIHQLTGRFS